MSTPKTPPKYTLADGQSSQNSTFQAEIQKVREKYMHDKTMWQLRFPLTKLLQMVVKKLLSKIFFPFYFYSHIQGHECIFLERH